jgi:hypothetical protein
MGGVAVWLEISLGLGLGFLVFFFLSKLSPLVCVVETSIYR